MEEAAVLRRERQLGLRQFGDTVAVSADPRACLMYYLDCICVVIDLTTNENLPRLRDFQRYFLLTEAEIDSLLKLTFLIRPDMLEGKVIFCNPEMCVAENNAFFELSAVESSLLISESIVIGGRIRHVKKIMTYTPQWIFDFYFDPMEFYWERTKKLVPPGYISAEMNNVFTNQRSRNSGDSCCCTIL